jgi:hypothetical protein
MAAVSFVSASAVIFALDAGYVWNKTFARRKGKREQAVSLF